jgi:hypothetical protein
MGVRAFSNIREIETSSQESLRNAGKQEKKKKIPSF